MDTSPAQFIILVTLLMLSAFFSSSETALTTVNAMRLRSMADNGNKSAKKVLKITSNSGKLLSTILVGNNIVNISASALATTIATNTWGSKSVGIMTGVLTMLVLIFGEITPKTLAANHATGIALVVVYPISLLMVVLTPVVWLLNIITTGILKLLRIDTSKKAAAITESELRTIVDVSHEEGVIEQDERFMISNVVDFGDALAKDVMIPRADVVFCEKNTSYDELVDIFIKEKYSRLPVYEDSKDNVIGILYLKDLFFYKELKGSEEFNIEKILRKPLFVHEYQKTSQLFSDLKTSSVSVAIVLDEYGCAAGIITMEDLIEEIVGEIRDEYDDDENDLIKMVDDNIYDVDASLKLDDLNDALKIKLHSDNYDSLGGCIIEILDKLPEEGEEAIKDNIILKVLRVEKNRVERVLLTITNTTSPDKEEGATA